MKIVQLKYLISLAETHSMNKTAQALYVSQSNISKQIHALEEELGFEILERSRQGIAFTSQGEQFLQDAYNLLDQYEYMEQKYVMRKDFPLHFSFASEHYIFTVTAAVEMIRDYADHPFDLEFRDGKTSDIIQSVATRKCDLGIISWSEASRDFILNQVDRHNLNFHNFCRVHPYVYLCKTHPLAEKTAVTMEELEPYPFVCYSLDTDRSSYAEEIIAPPHPIRRVQVTDRHALYNLIRHTTAYTLGSGFLTRGYTDENVISVPMAERPGDGMEIGWIYPAWLKLTALAEEFLERCRKAIRESDSAALFEMNEED